MAKAIKSVLILPNFFASIKKHKIITAGNSLICIINNYYSPFDLYSEFEKRKGNKK